MTEALVISFMVILMAALAHAVSGFGFALLAIPLLAISLGAQTAVICVTALGAVLSTGAMVRDRRYVQWRTAARMSVGAVAGMPFGLVALHALGDRILTSLIGVVVLSAVWVLARTPSLPSGVRVHLVAGASSGILLTSTGMNGPPLVLALHGNLERRAFRATLQSIFAVQEIFAIAAFAYMGLMTEDIVRIAVFGCLALPIGWKMGDALFHCFSAQMYRTVVMGGLVISAALAIVSAAK